MKTLFLAIALISTLLTAAPQARAGEALGAATTILFAMDFTDASSHKYSNVKSLQADAAMVVAGGPVSAALDETFAEFRKNAELRNLDDKSLAETILEALAQN